MKTISRKTVWRGFVRLEEVEVELGDGRRAMREVHDHGNAACVLPVDQKAGKLLLVRQMRMGPMLNPDPDIRCETPLLEVVAGLIDEGESPEDCALREGLEETGYEISSLEKIAQAYSSPGTLTEYFFLFAATYDSSKRLHAGGGLVAEGEEIEVVELDLKEAQKMLERGDIRDAKTIIALNWLFCQPALK